MCPWFLSFSSHYRLYSNEPFYWLVGPPLFDLIFSTLFFFAMFLLWEKKTTHEHCGLFYSFFISWSFFVVLQLFIFLGPMPNKARGLLSHKFNFRAQFIFKLPTRAKKNFHFSDVAWSMPLHTWQPFLGSFSAVLAVCQRFVISLIPIFPAGSEFSFFFSSILQFRSLSFLLVLSTFIQRSEKGLPRERKPKPWIGR